MDELAESLKEIVGDCAWQTDERALQPNLTEWRGVVRGHTRIMVQPDSTEKVAAVLCACSDAGVGVVPQGGNTGMCGGAVPDSSGSQVILNLSRMNRIRNIDADDFSMVAEAGCVLADLQAAARDAGRLFPLSHGGEDSAQIGGNLATNAGGINVIRYGTARNLVLGLEVVLADGTVLDMTRTLRKDTAGYDLKQLFIGSEGTLGVITAAAMALMPLPGPTTTAYVALPDPGKAVRLLGRLRDVLENRVQAFELIGSRAIDCVLRQLPETRDPLERDWPWYALLEVADAGDVLADTLMQAIRDGIVADAIVAKNESEANTLWHLRHSIPAAEKREGAAAKHDISLPVARLTRFLAEGERRLAEAVPDAWLLVFGHVGDGNLHYNAVLPAGASADETERLREAISRVVYGLVTELGGSISAEHGIGVLKKSYLARYKGAAELALMRQLKAALDPGNILNPGKVI